MPLLLTETKKSQYEELSLLTAMFVDDEFQWLGNEEQVELWKLTLVTFAVDQENQEMHTLTNKEIPGFRFRILLNEESWLNVFLPERYPEINPECYFSSDKANRQFWTLVNEEIETNLKERKKGECCIFDLYQHIKSFLQFNLNFNNDLDNNNDNDNNDKNSVKKIILICRILIWTHHLLSLEKRKNICQWAEELEIWGYSKPGYPGIIIAEGLYDNVQEYVSRLKNLRWQAITVRSEETETFENYDDDDNNVSLKKDDYKEYLKLKLGCNNPGISEMKNMSEISSRMKEVGLEQMFLSSMKIHKK
ncbi:hypothetical protein Glove_53g10 [Diversispora epigaea]|uniref:RWD domain-containing protein n=1 Tax=Diversispora epigaea TaxID=1348612 RepID=A0A397JP23_9GLOM|nr:hypothetical protein Glove_53g10 [Diversispora epigaea]